MCYTYYNYKNLHGAVGGGCLKSVVGWWLTIIAELLSEVELLVRRGRVTDGWTREWWDRLFVVTGETPDDRPLEVLVALAVVELTAPLLTLGIAELEMTGTWSPSGLVGCTTVQGGDSDAITCWTMVGISACVRGVSLCKCDVVIPCLLEFDFFGLLIASVVLRPPRWRILSCYNASILIDIRVVCFPPRCSCTCTVLTLISAHSANATNINLV